MSLAAGFTPLFTPLLPALPTSAFRTRLLRSTLPAAAFCSTCGHCPLCFLSGSKLAMKYATCGSPALLIWTVIRLFITLTPQTPAFTVIARLCLSMMDGWLVSNSNTAKSSRSSLVIVCACPRLACESGRTLALPASPTCAP